MLLLLGLLLTGVEAVRAERPADTAARMWSDVALSYVEVARGVLVDAPNGDVYGRAVDLGEAAAAEARAAGDRERLATALVRLGVLNLDPYSVGRTSEAYAEADARWEQRRPPGAQEMPDPLEALRKADELLRQAAELREGRGRGRALKARADALIWRRARGGDEQVAVEDLTAVIRAALDDLDPLGDAPMRLAMLNALRVHHQPYDVSELDGMLERSLDDWVHRIGSQESMALVQQAAPLLREKAPLRALELALAAMPLVQRMSTELRIAHLRSTITTLSRGLAGTDEPELEPGTTARRGDIAHRARA